MQKKKKRILYIVFFVVAIVAVAISAFFFLNQKIEENNETQPYKEMIEEIVHEPASGNVVYTTKDVLDITDEQSRRVIDLDALVRMNQDAIGWLYNGDYVDYPVIATTSASYYLHHDARKNYNRAGSLFTLKETNEKWIQPTNTVIYGHNMANGRTDMFSSLLKYKDTDYFEAHKNLLFDTIYGEGNYRIFAIFNLNIARDSYKYETADFANAELFDNYIQTAIKKSLYNTDIVPTFEDKIITLSTCDGGYGGKKGRFIIMAVKDKPEVVNQAAEITE